MYYFYIVLKYTYTYVRTYTNRKTRIQYMDSKQYKVEFWQNFYFYIVPCIICLNAARERREKVAVMVYATNGACKPLHQVLTPQDNEINRNIEEGVVLDLRYNVRPENSSKALELKKEEWLWHCSRSSL